MTINLPLIESTQNASIKELAKLLTKKGRDTQSRFLVEGIHLLQEAAQAGLLCHIYQLKTLEPLSLASSNPDSTPSAPIPVTLCSQAVLNRLSAQKSDARYIGVCRRPDLTTAFSAEKAGKVLLLDGLQDPGNVGTLIRSACSFGLDLVVLSPDCADPFNPKTIQSTQGALFHIPVVSRPLLPVIEALHERSVAVYGAALHQNSTELHDLPVPEQFALVIGNEGQGISAPVLQACSRLVHIEMAAFESLNAAIAGSILMYVFQFPAAENSAC